MVRKIVKSNDEKELYARKLLKLNLTYREIQEELRRKFKSGMSNSTLKILQDEVNEMQNLRAEVQHLRKELAMYKNLYFDLIETMKKTFK